MATARKHCISQWWESLGVLKITEIFTHPSGHPLRTGGDLVKPALPTESLSHQFSVSSFTSVLVKDNFLLKNVVGTTIVPTRTISKCLEKVWW